MGSLPIVNAWVTPFHVVKAFLTLHRLVSLLCLTLLSLSGFCLSNSVGGFHS